VQAVANAVANAATAALAGFCLAAGEEEEKEEEKEEEEEEEEK
jgi:hypothetical protein